jgi:PDZ domain-containing protein
MQSNDWGSLEPPGVKPVSGIHPWRYVIAAVVLVLLVLGFFLVPLSMYYVYLPGPASDVEKLVEVEGAKTYSSEGSLFLTTVTVDTEVTLFDLVQAGFDSQRAVVNSSALTQGGSLKDLENQQKDEMSASKLHAEEVALGALGLGRPTGDGAEVIDTIPNSPAENLLQKGDRIVALNGSEIQTTCDVAGIMNAVDAGNAVTIAVLRDGKRKTFEGVETTTNPEDGSALIGIQMRDVNFSFTPDVDVKFKTGSIGGPSAGLMFALGLYDRLTPDDLTGGRQIAGTGTIECDGTVGPIGGIEEKIAGAEREGAEIFLAPEADAANAKKVANDLTVVSIGSFQDAVDYLESRE